ncbi:response regulator transcription factor [Metabacillus sediminilitoris]|uniref:Response regulator n=1 Tax=Metabacillus sediminilitoris TaxID=2567941 RepID=A0A4S4BU36_9BACI|nr:response regulator [Metabacillus sediminilitoris]QGQ44961.1 response regulator [Metabacillus sediminilitoris]THF78595.1 response regulator [Metabacillus sediminilitoris]
MYKIILVDDDYLVLEFLTHMIPWAELGFSVVGSYQNGTQALEHIKTEMPDVIITDIGMPKMNGIELIRHIKEWNSTIYSIILSCHDDFHFAQQALKLETFDYILKESMEATMIEDLLSRLKEKLDQEKTTNMKKNQMEYLIKENLLVLKRRFLHAMIDDKQENKLWWEQQRHELGLASINQCTPLLCFIDRYVEMKEAFVSDELLKFSIDNLVNEILNQTGNGISIFYKDSMFFIFFPHGQRLEMEMIIQKALRVIYNKLQEYLNISISTIIGENCTSIEQLVQRLKGMITTSSQRFYMRFGYFGLVEQEDFTAENIFSCYTDAMQELKSLIIQEDVEELEKSLRKWVSFIEEKRYHPESVREWMMKIFLDIKLKFNSMQNFESTYSVSVSDHFITNVETIYQLEEELVSIFKRFIRSMIEINELPKRNEILKAQKYVLMNLNKKITLSDVAEHLHLNPSYFSRLYKKNTNENFIDYVTKSKMERAKELIDQSNESIEKISEMLGFDCKSYFIKTFKKYYGVTPKDYKQRIG